MRAACLIASASRASPWLEAAGGFGTGVFAAPVEASGVKAAGRTVGVEAAGGRQEAPQRSVIIKKKRSPRLSACRFVVIYPRLIIG
jgi:hypothetical protein